MLDAPRAGLYAGRLLGRFAGDEGHGVNEAEAIAATAALVLALTAAALVAYVVWTRRSGTQPEDDALAAVPVMILDEGRVRRLTHSAGDLLGVAPGDALAPALDRLFGPRGDEARALLDEATQTGRLTRRVLADAAGRPRLVRIGPVGARLRIKIIDLGDLSGVEALDTGPRMPEAVSALLAEAPLLAWHRDADGGVLWSAGEIRRSQARLAAQAPARMLANRRPAGDADGAEHARLELEAAPGERVPLQAVEIPRPDGTRVGFATEAGQLVAAERTLTRFVQTMTETFAHLTVGLAIFDANTRLALFNPTITSIWQIEPAWLAERPTLREILDALRSNRRLPEFRDYHAWRARLLALLDDPEHADYEELWSLPDGRTIRVLARPHPHGSLAFMFDDVTERLRLEQRNRSMDDLIRTTLDRLHEGITVFSADGQLRYVNDAFHDIWDTDAQNVTLDMHVRDVLPLVTGMSLDTEVWDRFAAFATGEAARSPWTARIELGSGRVLGARFAPLPDGSTMAVFADQTDSERIATALRERNEALESAEQLRAAVLDQISHRLRTPLNTVFGFGELLANGRAGTLNDRQQDYADGVMEGAAQLLDTISEVTELASLQIDPGEGEEGAQSVESVIGVTEELLQRRAEDARVHLSVDTAGPIGTLACNEVRLRQILFNLVADAIHRCPAGSTVRLSARREEDASVAIETREPVEPGKDDPLTRFELNSLTLSLVRRLVAGERGTLEIASVAETGEIAVTCRFQDRPALSAPARQAAG